MTIIYDNWASSKLKSECAHKLQKLQRMKDDL